MHHTVITRGQWLANLLTVNPEKQSFACEGLTYILTAMLES